MRVRERGADIPTWSVYWSSAAVGPFGRALTFQFPIVPTAPHPIFPCLLFLLIRLNYWTITLMVLCLYQNLCISPNLTPSFLSSSVIVLNVPRATSLRCPPDTIKLFLSNPSASFKHLNNTPGPQL